MVGCSEPPSRGRVIVAVTVDWEGAYISPDGLDAIDALRADPAIPLTHFISAAYFTKAAPTAISEITGAILPVDEIALHLHGWSSLATVAGVAPRVSPSFLTGTSEMVQLGDGDAGFDLDLDAYTGPELRALVRTTRDLLGRLGPVSAAFRAGGYLAGPRLLQALDDEGVTIDSSAIDPRQLEDEPVFAQRVADVWGATTSTQPWLAQGGAIVELPIAVIADYVTAAQVTSALGAATETLRRKPDRDVFVVLAMHQETAASHAPRLREGIDAARARGDQLVFVTITAAAARARAQLSR